MYVKRQSAWTFETSSSGGVGFGFVGAGGGTLFLIPPGSKTSRPFGYKYVGLGETLGIKLPKLPQSASVSGAAKSFPNAGELYILKGFDGNELQVNDITGFCTIQEVALPAATITVMFLGISRGDILKEIGVDLSFKLNLIARYNIWVIEKIYDAVSGSETNWTAFFDTNATSMLVIRGANASNTFAGVTGSWGYVSGPGESAAVDIDVREPVEWHDPDIVKAREDPAAFTIDGDALFDFDQYVLKPAAIGALSAAGKLIGQYKLKGWNRLEILGYTDIVGTPEYNRTLSWWRARTVKEWLISSKFAKEADVRIEGHGASFPVATNDTEDGRKKNRRVEIVIYPPRR
jgi:outer membrane protein OmpA-like peptidoglycan-associated protein